MPLNDRTPRSCHRRCLLALIRQLVAQGGQGWGSQNKTIIILGCLRCCSKWWRQTQTVRDVTSMFRCCCWFSIFSLLFFLVLILLLLFAKPSVIASAAANDALYGACRIVVLLIKSKLDKLARQRRLWRRRRRREDDPRREILSLAILLSEANQSFSPTVSSSLFRLSLHDSTISLVFSSVCGCAFRYLAV